MSQRPVDVVRELAGKVARRGLTWTQALRVAASERLVNTIVLQTARVDLGDEWASKIYENACNDAIAVHEEEISFPDTRPSELITDGLATEPGVTPHMTLNQLILTLAAMREQDPDVGAMRVVFGDERADVAMVVVKAARDSPASDADYVIVIGKSKDSSALR